MRVTFYLLGLKLLDNQQYEHTKWISDSTLGKTFDAIFVTSPYKRYLDGIIFVISQGPALEYRHFRNVFTSFAILARYRLLGALDQLSSQMGTAHSSV